MVFGDFNAHSPRWGSVKANCRGNRISIAVENCDMISVNDKEFTYIPLSNSAESNLDLIFMGTRTFPACSFEIAQDSYTSDHFPVLLDVGIRA